MTDPNRFFDEFVLPTVGEWRDDPLNVRRAVLAVCQLDCLTERCIISGGITSKKGKCIERTRHEGRQAMLAVARDVHDTHKHGPLTRTNAKIKQGQAPRETGVSTGLLLAITRPMLVVVEDDGKTHLLEEVIERCLAYWTSVLGRPAAPGSG